MHFVTVAKWETGSSRPRGMALKFLEQWIESTEENDHGQDAQ